MASQKREQCVKNWVFTLNNPTVEDLVNLRSLQDKCSWLIYGKETSASGTKHYQGACVLVTKKRISTMKTWLPRAHWEHMKGEPSDSLAYCSKEDKSPVTHGVIPLPKGAAGGFATKDIYSSALALAKEGKLDEIPANLRVLHYRTWSLIKKEHMVFPDDLDGLAGVWYYGPAGAGKSRQARVDFPSSYLKMANKWWDGYQDEETVLIDDLDKKHDVLGHHLKIWGDRYAFLAETKGGATAIRPKKIVITSQYHPNDIWADEETRAAILRRYKVTHFGAANHLFPQDTSYGPHDPNTI